MASRSRSCKKVAPEFTPAPTQNGVQTRPFAPPVQSDTAPTLADIQAQLDHAQRYGHHLTNFASSEHQSTTPIIQPKLTIGAPNDKYEQEADRVAQEVVQRLSFSNGGQFVPDKATSTQPNQPLQRETLPDEEDKLQMKPLLQREAMPEEDEELQMKPESQGGGAIAASDELETSIQQSRGSGQPLADSIREPMEQAFGGVDFSGVKVHTDARSDQLNRSIQAKAFTTGQDIFFRQGYYETESRGGKELIAHELTHVVQQGSKTPTPVAAAGEERSNRPPAEGGQYGAGGTARQGETRRDQGGENEHSRSAVEVEGMKTRRRMGYDIQRSGEGSKSPGTNTFDSGNWRTIKDGKREKTGNDAKDLSKGIKESRVTKVILRAGAMVDGRMTSTQHWELYIFFEAGDPAKVDVTKTDGYRMILRASYEPPKIIAVEQTYKPTENAPITWDNVSNKVKQIAKVMGTYYKNKMGEFRMEGRGSDAWSCQDFAAVLVNELALQPEGQLAFYGVEGAGEKPEYMKQFERLRLQDVEATGNKTKGKKSWTHM